MRLELDARERQEVVDQPRHAVGLRLHDVEEPLARLRVVAGGTLQRLDEAGQRGERRAQLVARIGDEIGAHLLDALERRKVVQRHDHEVAPSRDGLGQEYRHHERLRPAVGRHAFVELDPLGRAAPRPFAYRLDDVGNAQRER